MTTLGLEISGNALIGVFMSGNQQDFTCISGRKLLTTPKGATAVLDVLNFKTDFAMLFDDLEFDQIALCEGANESSKFRVRMEFAILSVCEDKGVVYNTYPSGSCTKMITTGFEKITGKPFSEVFNATGINQFCKQAFAVAFRFTE